MRIASAICPIVCVFALSLAFSVDPSEAHAQDHVAIPFSPAVVTTTPLKGGYYVFRDESEWKEKFVLEYPIFTRVPPAPDFSDSLVVAVSYGMSACFGTGGEIESILSTDQDVRIHLGHVYSFNVYCLAELTRQHFYRIAHADVSPDADFQFVPAELPYDLEPEQWYPLAVGNAWHFREYRDMQFYDRVEMIDEAVDVDEETWHRIVEVFPGGDAGSSRLLRYLRWTDEAFLLTSTDPSAHADTVHAEFLESPFLTAVPDRDVPLRAGGTYPFSVGVNAFGEFNGLLALWSESHHISYVQGVGPLNELVAAIIDGEHYEDTAFIMSVLSTEHPAAVITSSRIDVYPHPVGSESVIEVMPENSGEVRLVVYDVLGRLVLDSRTHVSAGSTWRLPLGNDLPMAPGLYVIRLIEEGGRSTERSFIVAR